MPGHFLRLSKSYAKKKGSSKFGSDEILDRRDLVSQSQFLDKNFELLPGYTASNIQKEVEKANFSFASYSTILNDIAVLKTARQYLLANTQGKISIRRESARRTWIIFALDCLDTDEILSWEQIEKLQEKSEEKMTTPAPEEAKEIPEETVTPPVTSSGASSLELGVKIQNATDTIQEMASGFCLNFPNLIQELTNLFLPALESFRKKELDLLDEVETFSNANKALEERLRASSDRNLALRKEIDDRDKRLSELISKILGLENGLDTQAAEYRKVYQNNKELIEQLSAKDRQIGNLLQEHDAEISRLQRKLNALDGSSPEKLLEKFKNFLSAEILPQKNGEEESGSAPATEPSEPDLVVATSTDELPTFCQATKMPMAYSEKFMERFFKFPEKHQKVIRRKLASFDPNRNSQKSRKLEVDGFFHDWLVPKIRVDWMYENDCMFFVRLYHKNEVKKI